MTQSSPRPLHLLPFGPQNGFNKTRRAALAVVEQLEVRQLLSTTIFSDGFEGTALSSGWTTRADAGTTTSVKWGVNRAQHASGLQSAFCAMPSTGSLTQNTYVNNQASGLLRGNVDLRGYLTASLSFKYLLNAESGYDFFTVNAVDANGVKTTLLRDTGEALSRGWQTETLDVSNLANRSGLGFEFRFDSDSSVIDQAPSGAWIDDVSLTAGTIVPPGTISGALFDDANGNRARDTNEGPLAGWIVYLDQNQNAKRDTGESYRTTDVSGAYSFTNLAPGTYQLAEEIKAGYQQTFPGAAGAEPASAFHIEVNYPDSSLSSIYRAAFQAAADKWDRIIIGDLPNVNDNGTVIDDLRIDATALSIDGVAGILGQSNPIAFRSGSLLPYKGFMQFDSADLADMQRTGQLVQVITHEMGHVLGFGTIWEDKGLLAGPGTNNPQFIGASATAQYNSIFHATVGSVPVENSGGAGTVDTHWRESVFGNELMTGYLNSGANPLSRITVGSIADLGYTVNYAAADSYNGSAAQVSGAPFSHTVTVSSGQTSGGINFGNRHDNRAPTISSLSDTPDPVSPGQTITLVANGAADADSNLSRVSFYRESNGVAGLQTGPGGDKLLGTDSRAADGLRLSVSTAGLAAGRYTYYAQATDSAGVSSGAGTSAATTTNTIGASSLISGVVYRDANGNGFVDGGDQGLLGWRVFIDSNNNGAFDTGERSAVTDSNGYYRFTGMAAGSYVVREVLQGGWNRSSPGSSGYTVNLGVGAAATGRHFGNYQYASIRGAIFNDVNASAVRDASEAGMANVRLYIDSNGNGAFDSATERSAFTDSAGNYAFTGLRPGRYSVRQAAPSGWRITSPANGYSLTLFSGQIISGCNFGDTRIISVASASLQSASLIGAAARLA